LQAANEAGNHPHNEGTVMTQAIAYLAFNGNCADAMRFYEKALHGKLELLLSGADSPMKD
jgi:PhnB protein